MPKRRRKKNQSKTRSRKKPPYDGGPVLRRLDAIKFTSLSETVFDELVQQRVLPQPFNLIDSGRALGWLRSELENWLAARAATRGAA
jgi:predicted DNA-binding transcriptional regulator AlpA